jgi:hypothetical protein
VSINPYNFKPRPKRTPKEIATDILNFKLLDSPKSSYTFSALMESLSEVTPMRTIVDYIKQTPDLYKVTENLELLTALEKLAKGAVIGFKDKGALEYSLAAFDGVLNYLQKVEIKILEKPGDNSVDLKEFSDARDSILKNVGPLFSELCSSLGINLKTPEYINYSRSY